MKCQACSQETLLPFRCPYCGGQFCSVHRLPENHACPQIGAARAQRQEQVMTSQGYGSYNYSYVFGQQPFKRKRHVTFSQKEVKHFGIAALLVVGIGFSIGLYGNFFGVFRFTWTYDMMAVFAVVMVASFLTHELAHKVIAQQRGLWAEFRLTTWGALLTFASIFLPFRMIAPGAMMIGGTLSKKDDLLKISIAGPITNLAYAAAFVGCAFALFPFSYGYSMLMFFAAYINAFMALFNLVPFGVLDGYKIFSVNKKLWALAFVPSVVLTIFTFLYI
jgi:Zn-dependent protease